RLRPPESDDDERDAGRAACLEDEGLTGLHCDARYVERDRRVRLRVERVGAHPRLDTVRNAVPVVVDARRDDARLPPAGAVDERAGAAEEGHLEVRAEAFEIDAAQVPRREHPGL